MTPEEQIEQLRKEFREGLATNGKEMREALADAVTLIAKSSGRPSSVAIVTPPPVSADDLQKTAKVLAHRDEQIVAHLSSALQATEQRLEAKIGAEFAAVRAEMKAAADQRNIAANAAVAAANASSSTSATLTATNTALTKQQQQLNGAIVIPSIIAILAALLNFATRQPAAPAPSQKVEVVVPTTAPTVPVTPDAGVHR